MLLIEEEVILIMAIIHLTELDMLIVVVVSFGVLVLVEVLFVSCVAK